MLLGGSDPAHRQGLFSGHPLYAQRMTSGPLRSSELRLSALLESSTEAPLSREAYRITHACDLSCTSPALQKAAPRWWHVECGTPVGLHIEAGAPQPQRPRDQPPKASLGRRAPALSWCRNTSKAHGFSPSAKLQLSATRAPGQAYFDPFSTPSLMQEQSERHRQQSPLRKLRNTKSMPISHEGHHCQDVYRTKTCDRDARISSQVAIALAEPNGGSNHSLSHRQGAVRMGPPTTRLKAATPCHCH